MAKVPVLTGLAVGEDTVTLCREATYRVIGSGSVLLLMQEGRKDGKYVFSLSYLTDGDEFTLAGRLPQSGPEQDPPLEGSPT